MPMIVSKPKYYDIEKKFFYEKTDLIPEEPEELEVSYTEIILPNKLIELER